MPAMSGSSPLEGRDGRGVALALRRRAALSFCFCCLARSRSCFCRVGRLRVASGNLPVGKKLVRDRGRDPARGLLGLRSCRSFLGPLAGGSSAGRGTDLGRRFELDEIRHERAHAVLVEIDDGVVRVHVGYRAGAVLRLCHTVTLGVQGHRGPLFENRRPDEPTIRKRAGRRVVDDDR